MNNHQENKLSSYKSTESVLDASAAIYDPNAGFKKFVHMYKDELSVLVNLSIAQMQDTTGAAIDKDELKNKIIKEIVQIAAALFALSFEKGDNTLAEMVNVYPSTLKELRDQELYAKCKGIYDKAVEYKTSIAEFLISPEKIENLGNDLKRFNDISSAPRTLIVTRKDATERIAEQIKKIDELLKSTLDKLINFYEFTNPDFYNQYKSSRMIVDHGIRHKKEVED